MYDKSIARRCRSFRTITLRPRHSRVDGYPITALVDAAGRRRVVHNGDLPERFVQTGIGPVSDAPSPLSANGGTAPYRYTRSAILPRSYTVVLSPRAWKGLLPWLYLLRDFHRRQSGEAVVPILGSNPPTGLSCRSTIEHE